MLHKFTALLFTVLIAFSFSTSKVNAQPEPQMSLDHTPGMFTMGIFNNGSVGKESQSPWAGPGVKWAGSDGCFTGGVMYGTSGLASCNGNIGSFTIADMKDVSSNFAGGFTSNSDFNQISTALLYDSAAPVPYGMQVIQKSYSNTGEEYGYVRYGFINTTGTEVTGLRAGIFIDWDIGSATANSGGYATDRNMVYNFDTGPGLNYYGIAALNGVSGMRTTTAGATATARTEAYNNISVNYADSALDAPGDYRTWIGSLVGNIAPGDTAWVTFAIVAGVDLAQIRQQSGDAMTKAVNLGWASGPGPEPQLSLTHTPGMFTMGIFNNGSVGKESQSPWSGPGVNWAGSNGAFTGGVIYGTSGDASCNGNIGSFNIADMKDVESNFAGGFTSNASFNQISTALLYDSAAPVSYGMQVIQKSYSNTGEEYGYVRYGFINNTGSTVSGLHAGLFMDWDIGSATANSGGYAVDRRLVYNFDTGPGLNYYGLAALDGVSGMRTTTSGATATARTEAYNNISVNYADSTLDAPGDYRTWIGTMIGDVAPGDTGWATFAVVAGVDLAQIRQQSADAQTKALALGWITTVGIDPISTTLPEAFNLSQNYPNPFNPSTTIKFDVSLSGNVKLSVYDALGRQVASLVNENLNAGTYEINWNAGNYSSGMYYYRLESGNFVQTKKMLLVK